MTEKKKPFGVRVADRVLDKNSWLARVVRDQIVTTHISHLSKHDGALTPHSLALDKYHSLEKYPDGELVHVEVAFVREKIIFGPKVEVRRKVIDK